MTIKEQRLDLLVGKRFLLKPKCSSGFKSGYYILSRITEKQFCMICLDRGNRWRDPVDEKGIKAELEECFEPHPVSNTTIEERIEWMNKTFELEGNDNPTDLGPIRLLKFYKTVIDEVTELLECTDDETLSSSILDTDPFLQGTNIDEMVEACKENGYPQNVNLTELADVLGDLMVYIFSEARRWGIPLIEVFHIIMDSQESKLVDGKPLKAPDGSKFIKGPNFIPPEERIRALIQSRISDNQSTTT